MDAYEVITLQLLSTEFENRQMMTLSKPITKFKF